MSNSRESFEGGRLNHTVEQFKRIIRGREAESGWENMPGTGKKRGKEEGKKRTKGERWAGGWRRKRKEREKNKTSFLTKKKIT